MSQTLIERIPPHNLEAEQAILGSMLINAESAAVAAGALEPGMFYREAHGIIFRAACELFRKNEPIDLVTMRGTLGDRLEVAGGFGYLVDLAAAIPTTEHTRYYTAMVAGHAERRRLIEAATRAIDMAFDTDHADPVGCAQADVMKLGGSRAGETAVPFHQVVEGEYGRSYELMRQRHEGRRVDVRAFCFGEPGGLGRLDEIIVPASGDMVIVGARPSAGKTAFGIQVASIAAKEAPVLFFSLEMTKEAIARRYIALLTGISTHRQRTGFSTPAESQTIAEVMASTQYLNLEIDDRPNLTVAQMRATALRREHALGRPLGLVIIDHMVKVRADNPRASGHEKMTQVWNDTKDMLKAHGWAGLALMQLRRPGQGQEDRKPTAADLRESGSAEEVGDVILLLQRLQAERAKAMGQARVIIEKHRDGAVGELDALFFGERGRFELQAEGWAE